MKNNAIHSIITSILLFATICPLGAQPPSRLARARTTLEKYSGKLQQQLQKITLCIRGDATCTQKQINRARIILGLLAAAVATLTIGLTARHKKWWPFKSAEVQETAEEQVTMVPEEEKIIGGTSDPLTLLTTYAAVRANPSDVAQALNNLTQGKSDDEYRELLLQPLERSGTTRELIVQLVKQYNINFSPSTRLFSAP